MADQNMAWIEASLAGCPRLAFQARLREELQRRIHMMTTMGVREGFSAVTPYITVVEIERVIAFAKEALGAVETLRTTGGAGGLHCEVRLGDSMLMLGGGASAQGREKPTALHVYLPDVDAACQRALAAGAELVNPLEDKPYGERMCGVKDAGGNLWFIATRTAPAHEALRTVTPYLLQVNALGLIEFLKAAFSASEIGVFKTPDGKVMHGALRIGDAALEIGDAEPMPAAFYLYVPDADATYRQAVEAGAQSLYPPADQPYGDRVGGVEDAWGNTWYIASHLG